MPRIRFISSEGIEFNVHASEGSSLMETARENSVPGIDADCGGACLCATCHVYIDEQWLPFLEKPGCLEQDMLGFACGIRPCSRLSCQITLHDGLDGLVVHIPESQC